MSDEQQYPPTWEGIKAAAPTKLEGVIVDARDMSTDFGDTIAIDVQRADGSVVSVPGFGAVLKRLLKEAKDNGEITPNAPVTVEFVGLGKAKPGRSAPRLYTFNGNGGSGGGTAAWFSGSIEPVAPPTVEPVAATTPAGSDLPF